MWCPLPWTHVGVKNNGTLRMCSHSQSAGTGNTMLIKDNSILSIDALSDVNNVLNCNTLAGVRKDIVNGEWPPQCKRCELDSATGINSRNEWETKRHLGIFDINTAISCTDANGYITDPKLMSLDLRIGNLCNLRCIMCFPGESTRWYKDYKEVVGMNSFIVDDKTYSLDLSKRDFDWTSDKEKIDNIVNSSQHLVKIKFGGGEPLLIKYHHYLLQELIAKGFSQNIELEYSVNLTIFPPALFDLWKQFKIIRICASVDALGEANDAIRYPSKWETIEKNLKMLDETDDNIIVFTSTTVNLLSLEYFSDLLIWIENQKFKKINKTLENPGVSHLVYNPEWLNINLLNNDQQTEIFSNLRNKAKNYPKIIKKINSYNKYCVLHADKDKTNLQIKFAEIFYNMQINQQQDFSNLFPFCNKLAKIWK